MRYFNNSCSFGLPPKIAIHAKPFKACCGTGAYKIAALKLGLTCNAQPDKFVVSVEEARHKDDPEFSKACTPVHEVETTMLFCTASKWLGFMVLNPYAFINDGLLDVCYLTDRNEFGLGGIGRLLKAGADGGVQSYQNCFKHTRGQNYRIKNNGGHPLLFNIDGEDWAFENFVKLETIQNGIEYCFDAKSYFQEFKTFN